MKSKGFTLIELVMVIIILGILAVTVLAVYINLSSIAKEKIDDAVIGAFKEALAIEHAANMVDQNIGDVWPGDPSDPFPDNNPFFIFSQRPPTKEYNIPFLAPDQTSWRYRAFPVATEFWIYCPHYNGRYQGSPQILPSQGRFYIYAYGSSSSSRTYVDRGYVKLNPGQIGMFLDWGH